MEILWDLVSQGEISSGSKLKKGWQSGIAYDLSPFVFCECVWAGWSGCLDTLQCRWTFFVAAVGVMSFSSISNAF